MVSARVKVTGTTGLRRGEPPWTRDTNTSHSNREWGSSSTRPGTRALISTSSRERRSREHWPTSLGALGTLLSAPLLVYVRVFPCTRSTSSYPLSLCPLSPSPAPPPRALSLAPPFSRSFYHRALSSLPSALVCSRSHRWQRGELHRHLVKIAFTLASRDHTTSPTPLIPRIPRNSTILVLEWMDFFLEDGLEGVICTMGWLSKDYTNVVQVCPCGRQSLCAKKWWWITVFGNFRWED